MPGMLMSAPPLYPGKYMNAQPVQARLQPHALKDAPALIEAVFPAQKVSFEAQRERKSNMGQTLTAMASYWKGRKPLILVRAILLGSLLPQTDDPEKDWRSLSG